MGYLKVVKYGSSTLAFPSCTCALKNFDRFEAIVAVHEPLEGDPRSGQVAMSWFSRQTSPEKCWKTLDEARVKVKMIWANL